MGMPHLLVIFFSPCETPWTLGKTIGLSKDFSIGPTSFLQLLPSPKFSCKTVYLSFFTKSKQLLVRARLVYYACFYLFISFSFFFFVLLRFRTARRNCLLYATNYSPSLAPLFMPRLLCWFLNYQIACLMAIDKVLFFFGISLGRARHGNSVRTRAFVIERTGWSSLSCGILFKGHIVKGLVVEHTYRITLHQATSDYRSTTMTLYSGDKGTVEPPARSIGLRRIGGGGKFSVVEYIRGGSHGFL